MPTYATLLPDDADRIAGIDRSEHIDGVYRVVDGALVLDDADEDSPTWSAEHVAAYAARLRKLLSSGGRAIGAWEGDDLVGFASLDTSGVGGDPTLTVLDMLYVTRGSRRLGIGRELTSRIAELARSLGAETLYISATPTRATVDAYLRMGAALATVPDPVLFAREPDDIHLLLRVD